MKKDTSTPTLLGLDVGRREEAGVAVVAQGAQHASHRAVRHLGRVERLAVDVVLLGEAGRDIHELGADDLYTFLLKPRDDLANETTLNRIGLEDDERSFHVCFSAKIGDAGYIRGGGKRKGLAFPGSPRASVILSVLAKDLDSRSTAQDDTRGRVVTSSRLTPFYWRGNNTSVS